MQAVRGIHHVAISVPDLEAATAFYCGAMGFDLAARYDFEPTPRGDSVLGLQGAAARSVMINAGNLYLEVFEFSHPTPAPQAADRPVCDHGYTHFALDVTDIDAVYQRLADAGVRWHCPVQEYRDDSEWFRNAYGRDPFGNVIEIQQLLKAPGWDLDALPRWSAEA